MLFGTAGAVNSDVNHMYRRHYFKCKWNVFSHPVSIERHPSRTGVWTKKQPMCTCLGKAWIYGLQHGCIDSSFCHVCKAKNCRGRCDGSTTTRGEVLVTVLWRILLEMQHNEQQ